MKSAITADPPTNPFTRIGAEKHVREKSPYRPNEPPRDLINLRKFIFWRGNQVVSPAPIHHCDVLKRARTRSNEPSRQPAIDQPHFTEISPWKRRRVNPRGRSQFGAAKNANAPGLKMGNGRWGSNSENFFSPLFFCFSCSPSTFHLAGYIY